MEDRQLKFSLGEVPGHTLDTFNPQHVYTSMKVFINPAVASLPQHQHLFAERGCYKDRVDGKIVNKVCGEGNGGDKESVLPPEYLPLELTDEQDEAWADIVKANVKLVKQIKSS